MQTINLPCPGCHTVLELDAGFAGGVCRCSHCGMLMTVPSDPKREQAQRFSRPARPDAPDVRPAVAAPSDIDDLISSLGSDDAEDGPPVAEGEVQPRDESPPMAGAMPDAIPSTGEIEGYRILNTLGRGAASVIYEVRDPRDSRRYALKQTVRLQSHDQRFMDQAINEHAIASQFNHPVLRRSLKLLRRRSLSMRTTQIVLVMELVEGQTLAVCRPTDMKELIRIFRTVAQGLGYMHNAGFIHADLKPINIMITPANDIKIIDFGQSCPVGTAKKHIQGTLDYMAPEQVKRSPLGVTTDVYNLGATMFWCVSGHHVPRGTRKRTGAKALRGVGRAEVPNPCKFNANAPASLGVLILDCLRREPAHRPPSMDQVIARLDVALFQLGK